MHPEEAKAVAEHQRRRFNELVDVFDRPQPPEVMAHLREIVASAALRPGGVVRDVGTGDVAEKMLRRVQDKCHKVRTCRTDMVSSALELNQVWTNIIDNVVDAMHSGGELRIRTFLDGDCAVVEIGDSGPGIPADIQSRIFEPFFTTKGWEKELGSGWLRCCESFVSTEVRLM
jgi:signal transduction histidine kinase